MIMEYQKDEKKRAAQLYGDNRTVDVSERRSVEVIEFEYRNSDTELKRLRKELEEISKKNEKIFEVSSSNVSKRLEKSVKQVWKEYLQKLNEMK